MEKEAVIGYNGGVIQRLYTKTTKFLDGFFQTDSKYLIKSGGWGVFANIIISILLFGLSLLYARVLSKGTYGSYRYIMSILSIGGFLLLPGIHTAFKRLAAQGYESLYRKDITYRLLASLLLALFGVVAGIYFVWFQNDLIIGIGLILASILVPLERGTGSFVDWFVLKKKFKEKAFARITEHVFFFVLMGLSLFYIRQTSPDIIEAIIIMVIAFYLGHGIPKVYYLKKILKEIPKNGGDKRREEEALKYGFHLSLGSIMPIIANNIDKILIHAFFGPISLAIYSFATVLPDQIRGFITSADSATVTKIFTKKNVDLEKLPKKLFKASAIIVLAVVAYIIVAPFVYKIFFPRYLDSVVFSQIFSLTILFIPFSYLNSALVAKGHIKRIYAHRTTTAILQVILLVVLIPLFGITGAVLSRVIGKFIESVVLYGLFKIKR